MFCRFILMLTWVIYGSGFHLPLYPTFSLTSKRLISERQLGWPQKTKSISHRPSTVQTIQSTLQPYLDHLVPLLNPPIIVIMKTMLKQLVLYPLETAPQMRTWMTLSRTLSLRMAWWLQRFHAEKLPWSKISLDWLVRSGMFTPYMLFCSMLIALIYSTNVEN